jgi:hypothetical protein
MESWRFRVVPTSKFHGPDRGCLDAGNAWGVIGQKMAVAQPHY